MDAVKFQHLRRLHKKEEDLFASIIPLKVAREAEEERGRVNPVVK